MVENEDFILNPNCSDIVFRLDTIPVEIVREKLRRIGIIEVSYNDDGKYPFLADRDNPMVPNMDAEYGCDFLDIDIWSSGETVIHGGINLSIMSFPTLKKIQDAFPGRRWEEMIGGEMTEDFEEWIANGMQYTDRVLKFETFESIVPGEKTVKFRKDIVEPTFEKSGILNPNCSEVVFSLEGMSREEALHVLAIIGISEIEIPSAEFWGFETGESDEMEKMLSDKDNPNIPDFTFQSRLCIENSFDVYGLCIVGHQDCQEQMYPTMLKIEEAFQNEWYGYDGGGVERYNEWASSDDASRLTEDIQDDVGREKRMRYVGDIVASSERKRKSRIIKRAKRMTECANNPDSEI